MGNVSQHVHLQVWCERVWKPHIARKSTQYQVTHLNTVWWDDITESIMVITEEFREVM